MIQRKAERLFARQSTKDKLAMLYQTAGLEAESEKIKNCCQKFGTLICSNSHIAQCYPTERCRLPLCPDCAVFRQKRAFKRLFPKIQGFISQNEKDRLVLITLTLKNSSDNLLQIHRFFKKAFRKLRQTVRWKSKIRGGLASFEVTIDAEGNWHYHAHILALRKSFDRYEQSDLTEDWRRATNGRGFITDIRQIRDLKSGFKEVLKYSFKPLDIEKNRFDSEHLRQFYELCKSGRLSDPFGAFYGLKTDENGDSEPVEKLEIGSPCPKCQNPLDFVFYSRSEIEIILLNGSVSRPLVC